jgi:16S rRNA (adenine1518-N6/adenine1519-N6)-dimethyltransferase
VKAFQVLREHGVQGKKQLGQHFLVDPVALQRIVDAADLSDQDTVLEIGPGPGTLTVRLAQQAKRVIAVEVDERMLAPLRQLLREHGNAGESGEVCGRSEVRGIENVRIVHGDILEQDIPALVGERPYKVVANLPYYITSAVLRHVLESALRPRLLVVTVQREVAERIVGRPAKGRQRAGRERPPRLSLLAVSVQFYGVPRIVARIPAGAFRPMPAVQSAILRIDVHDPLPWPDVDVESFFRVARAGFSQPRKQLHNTLTHGLSVPADEVAEALEKAAIDGRRRAETLSVTEWVALTNALGPRAAAPGESRASSA